MQGDNLHKVSKSFFCEKIKNIKNTISLSSTEFAQRMVKVKSGILLKKSDGDTLELQKKSKDENCKISLTTLPMRYTKKMQYSSCSLAMLEVMLIFLHLMYELSTSKGP